MGDTAKDPVDHARTTRPRAGEAMKDGTNLPGMIVTALGVVMLVITLFLFAAGNSSAGIVGAVVAAVLFVGGLSWLYFSKRRVRRLHAEWLEEHPEASAPPMTN